MKIKIKIIVFVAIFNQRLAFVEFAQVVLGLSRPGLSRFGPSRNGLMAVLPKKPQLCSARMHLAANSVHTLAPPVGPQ